jgi:hypothetical protein
MKPRRVAAKRKCRERCKAEMDITDSPDTDAQM